MSLEQLKREVTTLSDSEQAELMRYLLQLRNANDRREVSARLNDWDKSYWLTPDEFECLFGDA